MYPFKFILTTQRLLILCVFTLLFHQESISGKNLTKSESLSDDKKSLIIIYPKVRFKRSLENDEENNKKVKHDLQIQFNHDSEEFAIYLRKNEHLVTSGTVVEWNYPNGTKQLSKLSDIGKDDNNNHEKKDENPDDCLFIGEVVGGNVKNTGKQFKSVAAIDVCDGGYRGYLQIGKDGYIIRPLKEHEIYLHPKHPNEDKQQGNSEHGPEFTKGFDNKNARR
jgi:hypothetical protein